MKKKFIYYIFFLSFLFCNSGISKEINNTYSCSQPDWIDEKLTIYNSFDNDNFVTYSLTVLGGEYLDFGQTYEGRIYGYNRSGKSLNVDEIGEEVDKVRIVKRYSFYSNEIENLDSGFKSILENAKDFKNFNLSDAQLDNEIQNYSFTKNYILDLNENNLKKFQDIFLSSGEYTCKKINSENQKNSKSGSYLKDTMIKQMEDGCLQGAKNDNNLTPKVKKYCKCYANWFDENLNQNELIEFMNKATRDKKTFVWMNNITGKCS